MMMTKNSFYNAAEYVRNNSRPLEKALLEYEFFGGAADSVLAELLKFQNADGGFGKALEADFRAEKSSVLCTTYAMDLLLDLKTPSENELVRGASSYLLSVMDEASMSWRLIPEGREDYPHAPWWNQDGLEKVFNNFIENPRVKICAYMYHYPDLFPQESAGNLLNEILNKLDERSDTASYNEIECYIKLFGEKNVPEAAKKTLLSKLNLMIPSSVEQDVSQWHEYVCKPVDLIKHPDSVFLPLISELMDKNLQFEIEHQLSDFSWAPNWNWGDSYPDDWMTARAEWSGVLTVKRLRLFKSFNLIEA